MHNDGMQMTTCHPAQISVGDQIPANAHDMMVHEVIAVERTAEAWRYTINHQMWGPQVVTIPSFMRQTTRMSNGW